MHSGVYKSRGLFWVKNRKVYTREIKDTRTKQIRDLRGTQKSKISGVLETRGFHEFENARHFQTIEDFQDTRKSLT